MNRIIIFATVKYPNMRKHISILIALLGALILLPTCNSSESIQEKLRKQQRAIDKYMDMNGLVTLSKFPADTVFKANEYYKTGDGLYINIANKGNRNKPQPGCDVTVRFSSCFDVQTFVEGDEEDATYIPSELVLPFEFKYGISSSYSGYACDGWAYALSYVGEGAIVNLIVPSKLTNPSIQSLYRAICFKDLEFTYFSSYAQ